MYVFYTRITNESFGNYNLPSSWRYETITNFFPDEDKIHLFGPEEWTDVVKDSMYMKFSELKNEGIISDFRIADKDM